MAVQCNLDHDTGSNEVVRNYDSLIIDEIVLVRPEAYFRMKQLVATEINKERGLLHLIPMI